MDSNCSRTYCTQLAMKVGSHCINKILTVLVFSYLFVSTVHSSYIPENNPRRLDALKYYVYTANMIQKWC